jgi:hypothetical protein
MGRSNSTLLVFFALLSVATFSQTIRGVVLDQKTNLPIESASVYFDGTTIGTSTDDEGRFKIELTQGVTSPMIISSIGYKRVILGNYNAEQDYNILLEEDLNTLDEVFISSDDGMSKATKLKHFKREFLGWTDNGLSCKILNESDLILRFNSKNNQLTASSKRPIVVENEDLKYRVSFEIQDFAIDYAYADLLTEQFNVKSVIYSGTTFFTDLDTLNTKKIRKRRDKTYEGSSLHFMRALSKKQLTEYDYKIFDGSYEVPPYKFIVVAPMEDSQNVNVSISKQLTILYDKKLQSAIRVDVESFIIDDYGNYAPIDKILFGGDMGDKRLGDTLPSDYQLIDGK